MDDYSHQSIFLIDHLLFHLNFALIEVSVYFSWTSLLSFWHQLLFAITVIKVLVLYLKVNQFIAGAKTCIEKCDRELDEVMNLLENIERQVVHYERKLAMAEKHFHSRRRRVAVGHNKNQNDLKEKKG